MKEENKLAAAMDVNCTGKLNFNAPLLSTRHPVAGISRNLSQGTSRDTSTGVPFSWEEAPGKPKDTARFESEDDDLPPPPPGLPPGRRHQHYDADVDDGDVDLDLDADVFSDAIDMFSLSDALDHIVEAAAEKVQALDGGGGGGLNPEALEFSGSESPNFIIQRFLPAAQALAASSAALNGSNNCPRISTHPEEDWGVGRSYSSAPSSRVCGLEFFFPWRVKHKLCGVKSPVRHCRPPTLKPESFGGAGGGRHKRNYSLVERHLRDYGV